MIPGAALLAAACLLAAQAGQRRSDRQAAPVPRIDPDRARRFRADRGRQERAPGAGIERRHDVSRPGKFRWQIDKPYASCWLATARKSGSTTRICARSRSEKRARSAERRPRCSPATADRKETSACAKPASAMVWSGSKRFPRRRTAASRRSASALPATNCARWSCSTASARPPRWSSHISNATRAGSFAVPLHPAGQYRRDRRVRGSERLATHPGRRCLTWRCRAV
jgi:hypothetical protein